MRACRIGRRPAAPSATLMVAYLLVGTAVTGCERDRDAAAKQALRGAFIAVVGPHVDHPQWPGIRGGARRYMDGVPSIRGDCLAPPEATPDSLAKTVRRVLERHPQAVCLYVADPVLVQTSIDLIKAEQTVLITMGRPTDAAWVYGHVGVGLTDAAEQLGANLKRVAGGRKSYLLLHEGGRGSLATNCYQRFIAAAQRQPDLVLLREISSAQDSRPQPELVEELLAQFTHSGLLVTLNPDVWLASRAGWNRRLRQLNSEFRFATLAAPPVLWPRLGTPAAPGDAAALVGPLDGELGYAAVEMAMRAILVSADGVRTRSIRCEVVTPENLIDFARRYSEAANGLDVSEYLPGMPILPSQPAED